MDLPELQGDAYSVARQKCRLAAEQVRFGRVGSLLIWCLVLYSFFSLLAIFSVVFPRAAARPSELLILEFGDRQISRRPLHTLKHGYHFYVPN